MPFTAKLLAEGQVSDVLGALYTVPGGTKGYVKYFNLYNSGGSIQVITVYVNTRKVRRISIDVDESYDVLEGDRSIELEAGDAINAESTDPASVDFVITGVEET